MNALLSFKKALLLCTVILLGLTLTSWQGGVTYAIKAIQDTVPTKSEKKSVDLDEALNNIDHAQADLEKSVKDIDWKKMNADLKETMKNLDVELKNMNVELKKSMQQIDVEKMKQDIDASVAKIDWYEMKHNIDAAKAMDMDKVKAEVEKAKAEIEKQKPEIEKSLQNARREVEKAKENLKAYKTFVDGLERDGLINKKESYKIEHKEGRLIINGKEQPASVYNKYRTFLEKNKTFTIEKNLDDFNIKND